MKPSSVRSREHSDGRRVARHAAYAAGIPAAAYFAWSAVRLACGTSATVATLSPPRTSYGRTSVGPGCRFVVILPMLREDRLVVAACEQFGRAAQEGFPIDVVVVTSDLERVQRDAALDGLDGLLEDPDPRGWRELASRALTEEGVEMVAAALAAGDHAGARGLLRQWARPTTAEAAQEPIALMNRRLGRAAFRLVDGDASIVTKVDKLNAAVATLEAEAGDDLTTFVVVFDADSAPDFTAFAAVHDIVAGRHAEGCRPPDIFQQVSCYCRNLAGIRGAPAPFVVADALAQTRWALGFEYPLYRRYAQRVRAGRLRPLVYCIGHGCFVSLAFLRRIGGFPTVSPTDDLALGYLASAMGAEVVPVPALDYCDVAPRPLLSVLQSRFWFAGSARFHRDLQAFRPHLPTSPGRIQWAYLHLEGHARNVAWAGRGIFWLGPVALGVWSRAWGLVGLLGSLHLAYVQVGFLQTLRALRGLPGALERTHIEDLQPATLALASAAASATFLLRSAGPLIAAAQAAAGRTPLATKIER